MMQRWVDGSPHHLRADNGDGVGGLATTVGMQDFYTNKTTIIQQYSFLGHPIRI
jgi:hypothetical protein